MSNSTIDNHESYGMIGISYQRRNNQTLFGSTIKHDHVITLTIKKADVERKYHEETFFGREKIIEINLSSAQFTQFITNPNFGDGIPCTIKWLDGKHLSNPPYRGQNEIFNQELQSDFKKIISDSNILIKDATEILSKSGNIKVADRKKLLHKLEQLIQHIKINMPYLHQQFTKSMDKTVGVAKREIENFYTSTIMKLGRKTIQDNNTIKLPEIENEK